MKNYRKVLEQFFNKGGMRSLKIEQMFGSSDSSVFLVGKKIYRVGAKADIDDSMDVYARFKKLLLCYNNIFPQIELVANGDISIARMEYIGEYNLEKIIFQMGKKEEGIAELSRFNYEVLEKLRVIQKETSNRLTNLDNLQQNKLFFNELIDALSVNFEKADIKKEGNLFLNKLKANADMFIKQTISSLAHKDFSVGNIIIWDEDKSVKFIDPRNAVPYLIKSKAMGNVAIDIAGYLVSIERKEMELQHEYPLASLKLIKDEIGKEIEKYYNEGVFSPMVLNACMALWYSVYVACKCEYCVSKKEWLYNKMVQCLKIFLDR